MNISQNETIQLPKINLLVYYWAYKNGGAYFSHGFTVCELKVRDIP
jgi:hypothetical protein